MAGDDQTDEQAWGYLRGRRGIPDGGDAAGLLRWCAHNLNGGNYDVDNNHHRCGWDNPTTESPDDDVTDPFLEELPDSFVIEFEERYLCDLGPYGFSDIHACGSATVGTVRAPTAVTFYGRGALDIEASLKAGEVCSGSAEGSHSIEEISGTVDFTSSGEPELQLHVNGAWYETLVGEIVCAPGIPSLGPWEWPTELHSEYIFFSPIAHDAVWEKDITVGRCTGTITRRLDFESVPIDVIPVP